MIRARLRFAASIAPGAWALVTLLLYLWHPLLAALPTWALTMVIVPQMVIGMVFLVIPLAQRLLPVNRAG